MSVTLTNITGSTEVKRSIQKSPGMLDTITSTYIVPTYLLALFIPNQGSAHPAYPLMQVWSSTIADEASGTLSAINVTYKGKLTTNGVSKFVSENVISENVQEKEFSYATQTISGGPQQQVTAYPVNSLLNGLIQNDPHFSGVQYVYSVLPLPYRVITYSWAIRYLTNNVKYKYCCNFDPTGTPQFQTAGFAKCAIEFQFTTLMSRSATDVADTTSLPVLPTAGLQNLLINMSVNKFNGWYECEETYEKRWVLV